jgi:hypothetical protein
MKTKENPDPQALKSDIFRLRKEAESMPNVIRFLNILYCQVENAKKKRGFKKSPGKLRNWKENISL